MTFQPVVPLNGIAGWSFLQRTYDVQFQAFTTSSRFEKDFEVFREGIASISTAQELVSDRRLLAISLGAFGLSDDINNKAFLQRILEDGTASRDALANRLADQRYRDFSDAFGFGPSQVRQTETDGFSGRIIELFKARQFEQAVGNVDETMRIALFSERELTKISKEPGENDTKWYSIMGLPPLRRFMETALGLPESFGRLDLDKQLTVFQEKSRLKFGSDDVTNFSSSALLSELTNSYLARSQVNALLQVSSAASTALSLLLATQRSSLS